MTPTASDIRDRGAKTRDAGARLAAASPAERAAWLDAAARLLEADAIASVSAIADETGLSEPMVRWGVATTLATVTAEDLGRLSARATREGTASCALLAVVLAGNLFTASIRALVVPLVLGVPVLAKASSSDQGFVRAWVRALRRADPALGAAADVVAFPGGELASEAALTAHASSLAVYGGDGTVAALRSRHPDVPVIAHGHGLSASYCGESALQPARIEETLSEVALDICAYDQRGCLSPQVIFVEPSARVSPDGFAEGLADRLGRMNESLPRGPLPLEVGAVQAQWRGLAEIEGRLLTGPAHGVAVSRPDDVRWSPGYRNVTVAPARNVAEAAQSLRPLGAALKCVGVDGVSEAALAEQLANAELPAYTTPLGRMQTPAIDAPSDGEPAWHGLLR